MLIISSSFFSLRLHFRWAIKLIRSFLHCPFLIHPLTFLFEAIHSSLPGFLSPTQKGALTVKRSHCSCCRQQGSGYGSLQTRWQEQTRPGSLLLPANPSSSKYRWCLQAPAQEGARPQAGTRCCQRLELWPHAWLGLPRWSFSAWSQVRVALWSRMHVCSGGSMQLCTSHWGWCLARA